MTEPTHYALIRSPPVKGLAPRSLTTQETHVQQPIIIVGDPLLQRVDPLRLDPNPAINPLDDLVLLPDIVAVTIQPLVNLHLLPFDDAIPLVQPSQQSIQVGLVLGQLSLHPIDDYPLLTNDLPQVDLRLRQPVDDLPLLVDPFLQPVILEVPSVKSRSIDLEALPRHLISRSSSIGYSLGHRNNGTLVKESSVPHGRYHPPSSRRLPASTDNATEYPLRPDLGPVAVLAAPLTPEYPPPPLWRIRTAHQSCKTLTTHPDPC